MRRSAFLCLTLLTAFSTAQERPLRPLLISYHQRLLSQDQGEGMRGAPELWGIQRLHGMELEGMVTDHVSVGLFGSGTMSRRDNTMDSDPVKAFADWGGGVAGALAVWHFRGPYGLQAGVGAGLGCGRISRTEGLLDGSRFAAVQQDAIFAEPRAEVGWTTARDRLVLRVQVSWIQPFFGSTYREGATALPDPFAHGPTAGLSLGYQFPLLTTGH